jgi:hypothetical protein
MKVPLMSLVSSRALHLFKGMSVIVEQHLVRNRASPARRFGPGKFAKCSSVKRRTLWET